ncbi:MAG: hypothetical protein Q7V57_13215 [Actinomycetota bacterium]|nr:hypothetical protein [Actinomycetota bacterium]
MTGVVTRAEPGSLAGSIIGLVGHGVTGGRVAVHLASRQARIAVHDPAPSISARGAATVRVDAALDLASCDLVVLCQPAPHLELAERFLAAGTPVVSLSDDLDDLTAMLELQPAAVAAGVGLVVGAGMSPGLSGLLAAFLAEQLHVVDELHVAIHGTAGPACARQHHEALGDTALGWHDDAWIEPPGGSGRDLVWFPEPIGAHDCYRAALGDPLLLHRAFPRATRISARVSATRRDRLTARLPMLTPPHASGDLGSVRVEARGAAADGERVTVIAGASGPTAHLAAAACAATALQVLASGVAPGVHVLGEHALAGLDLLHHTTGFGVRVQEFTGVARPTSW